ncbi:MAG: anti-anti-sigma factor [Anaerolineaceae bacterium]|nr:anti-anti-sigma factor [Anaerolineaceae bacterium]
MIEINISDHQQVTLVEVSGRVDSMNANELGSAINHQVTGGHVRLVLDLSHVEYMSSAGLREIVVGLKATKRASGDLRIAQPSDRVREVLEMSGLDSILNIYESQSAAITSY